MSTETRLGLTAIGSGLLGAAAFFAPEYAPKDWTFVTQNTHNLQITGLALWAVTGITTLALRGIAMNQKGWEPVDPLSVSLISPTPHGIEAGRRDDRRRTKKAQLALV